MNFLTMIDDRSLSDVLKYAAAHGELMDTQAHAPTVPSMPAVEPRPTVPASPKGKRAGTYSYVSITKGVK